METKQAIITGIFLGNGSGVLSRISVRTAFATQDGRGDLGTSAVTR